MLNLHSVLFRRRARAALATLTATAGLAAAIALPAQAQSRADATRDQQLSRAEVMADLALWRRAGVDRYDMLAHSYGLETEAYRVAYQEYLRLRNSDQFQAEVQKALSR